MKSLLVLLLACQMCPVPVPVPVPVECSAATMKNTCTDYTESWVKTCPEGSRCVTFTNACTYPVALTYSVGCDGTGKPGAPQCASTEGPKLATGASESWVIVDSATLKGACKWSPDCLTEGLEVMANANAYAPSGTRVEFTSGNSLDPYAKFDSYDLDIELGFTVPVAYGPSLQSGCANDFANHDCRPLYCDSGTCPDAFSTATSGTCPDRRSPAAGCQDTFSGNDGYLVTFCPDRGESCQDATACLPGQ